MFFLKSEKKTIKYVFSNTGDTQKFEHTNDCPFMHENSRITRKLSYRKDGLRNAPYIWIHALKIFESP